MGSFRALSLAGVIALGAIGSASAADLLPPAPPVEAPIMAPADFGGWYLRADAGVGATQISDLRSSFMPGFIVDNPRFESKSLSEVGTFGFGVGYQFNSWFRGDVTAEYRTPAEYLAVQSYGPLFCGAGRCYDGYRGNVQSGVFMANGYVDLGTWAGFTPYVGVGVGLAHHRMKDLTDTSIVPTGGVGFAPSTTTTNFAWAVMAGASYSLTSNLKLDLGYRYLDMGKITTASIGCQGAPACGYEVQSFKVASHDFRLGLRYMFSDFGAGPIMASAPMYSRPGPLVRKY